MPSPLYVAPQQLVVNRTSFALSVQIRTTTPKPSMAPSDSNDADKTSKRYKGDFCDTPTIFAGKDEKKYVLHTKLVTKKSAFFQTMCKGEWNETKDEIVCFPEIKTCTFET